MRSFGSDNHSGIHPDVLAAIHNANVNHACAYGDDACSEELQEKVVCRDFRHTTITRSQDPPE
jgi:threonine aldolase